LRTAAPPEVAIDVIRKRTWEVCGLLQRETAENIARNDVDYIEGEASLDQDGIRCGGTLNTISNMSMATPTYAYAYKYAAFDGLRRIAAAGKESLDESAKQLSQNL
jgi:hypothetical protein